MTQNCIKAHIPQNLMLFKNATCIRIYAIPTDPEIRHKMLSLGIIPGNTAVVKNITADHCKLCIRNTEIVIDSSIAKDITAVCANNTAVISN